jgi:hypothetical protein
VLAGGKCNVTVTVICMYIEPSVRKKFLMNVTQMEKCMDVIKEQREIPHPLPEIIFLFASLPHPYDSPSA